MKYILVLTLYLFPFFAFADQGCEDNSFFDLIYIDSKSNTEVNVSVTGNWFPENTSGRGAPIFYSSDKKESERISKLSNENKLLYLLNANLSFVVVKHYETPLININKKIKKKFTFVTRHESIRLTNIKKIIKVSNLTTGCSSTKNNLYYKIVPAEIVSTMQPMKIEVLEQEDYPPTYVLYYLVNNEKKSIRFSSRLYL